MALLLASAPGPVLAQGTPGLAEARQRANAAAAEMNELESRLGELDEAINQSRLAAEQAGAEAEARRDDARDLLVERYVQHGDGSTLAADPTEIARMQVLLAAATGEDMDAVDAFGAARARQIAAESELADQERDQSDALAALSATRERLDAELATLEAAEAQRLAEEQRRRQEEARRAAEAEARARAAAQATATTATTAASSTGGGSSSTGRPSTTTTSLPTTTTTTGSGGGGPTGSWTCPVQGARSFVDSWGFPRPGGRRHQGVDIMSPRGTPVVTPVAGTVSLRSNSVGGLSFHLMGVDGNYYYGTHLDSYADLANGSYPAGTVVGYVGDSGDAKGTGTHLHFEIHLGGQGNAVNPYPTVARYC